MSLNSVGSSGPFLTAALFCERVLEERDGVLTLVRIVDRFIQRAAGPSPPPEMPSFPINVTVFISVKSGAARGRHTITVRPEDPSGLQLEAVQLPVLFEGEDRGSNLVLNVGFQAEHEGLYWFDVLLDEKALLTRMPLRVVYEPTRLAGTPPTE